MPLTRRGEEPREASALVQYGPEKLFPGARSAKGALSGALLLCGCWSSAHEVAQGDASPEGSYWHGIIHRQEPDTANAAYWFRHAGGHPIFAELRAAAAEVLDNYRDAPWRLGPSWDPFQFLAWCDEVRNKPDSEFYDAAVAIQHVEWQQLFGWCVSPAA